VIEVVLQTFGSGKLLLLCPSSLKKFYYCRSASLSVIAELCSQAAGEIFKLLRPVLIFGAPQLLNEMPIFALSLIKPLINWRLSISATSWFRRDEKWNFRYTLSCLIDNGRFVLIGQPQVR
jgi:hypothetical protein